MAESEEFVCEICGETFETETGLQSHGEDAHQDHDPDDHVDQP